MSEGNKHNEDFVVKTLSDLAWNNEVCRWVIYEMKNNSEKGEILKEIYYLLYDSTKSLLPLTARNIPWLISELAKQGFNRELTEQVILFLVQPELEN